MNKSYRPRTFFIKNATATRNLGCSTWTFSCTATTGGTTVRVSFPVEVTSPTSPSGMFSSVMRRAVKLVRKVALNNEVIPPGWSISPAK